jgi:hypothetical protein
VSIAVRIEPASASPGQVEYRWDPDTDILTASVRHGPEGDGGSASVEIEGRDGSWLVLDVASGQISGVEVAVWPEVKKRGTLSPPADVQDAMVTIPTSREPGEISSIEMNTALAADSDTAERTFHFRLGPSRETRTVRIAREILIDLDRRDRIAGLWLLDVPPFPADQ